MSTKPLYLFANWKMYLDYAESAALAESLTGSAVLLPPNSTMVVFPSALSFANVAQILRGSGVAVGAQNLYWVDKGGYTGEVSSQMYKEVGASYALVGHSERRHLFRESNSEVRHKLEAALGAGLVPVVCVGETKYGRENGVAEEIIEAQLRAAFTDMVWPENTPLFIAYEPVWAVGTAESRDASEAGRIATIITKFIVGLLGTTTPIILYGGSVRPENVAEYVREEHISGVLVGGAATKTTSWLKIVQQIHA